jgi:hypothetical protein
MTALAVAIALVIGVLCSEVLARGARKDGWAARRLVELREELELFQAALDDDARQRHLVRGGVATLTLSLAVLVSVAIIGFAFAAPMVLLAWDSAQAGIYLAVSGASAIAWWWLRRAPRGA